MYIKEENSKTFSIHFSQCFPVSPSLQWHCCHDQWSTQVPPCWQGLVVQAPSSLGHLKQMRKEDAEEQAQISRENVLGSILPARKRKNGEALLHTQVMFLKRSQFSSCNSLRKEKGIQRQWNSCYLLRKRRRNSFRCFLRCRPPETSYHNEQHKLGGWKRKGELANLDARLT